MCIW